MLVFGSGGGWISGFSPAGDYTRKRRALSVLEGDLLSSLSLEVLLGFVLLVLGVIECEGEVVAGGFAGAREEGGAR